MKIRTYFFSVIFYWMSDKQMNSFRHGLMMERPMFSVNGTRETIYETRSNMLKIRIEYFAELNHLIYSDLTVCITGNS